MIRRPDSYRAFVRQVASLWWLWVTGGVLAGASFLEIILPSHWLNVSLPTWSHWAIGALILSLATTEAHHRLVVSKREDDEVNRYGAAAPSGHCSLEYAAERLARLHHIDKRTAKDIIVEDARIKKLKVYATRFESGFPDSAIEERVPCKLLTPDHVVWGNFIFIQDPSTGATLFQNPYVRRSTCQRLYQPR